MRAVTDKPVTRRRAVAQSVVRAQPATLVRLRSNDLPKQDVLPLARAAGVMAAKKTSDLIPYCHPIAVDAVEVEFQVQADQVTVIATVESIARTGVEMEALTAATVAALTIYDMLKPVDDALEIVGTKLIEKKGGKTSFQDPAPAGFRAEVMVTSDGTFQGKRPDKSGKIIVERLREVGIAPGYTVLPDDLEQIRAKLTEFAETGVDLVLTTGGTGLGPRDVTVEATRQVMDREVPGIVEAARAYGQQRTPYAMLSRGLAAQKGRTLIVNLPGSSAGVRESLQAIFPWLLHVYGMMRGGGH